MFRSIFFIVIIINTSLIISATNEKNVTMNNNNRRNLFASIRKPVSIKICGLALIRMLDMVCTRARQLLMRSGISSSTFSSPAKRQFNIDDDPYSRTVSITDYTQFNDTLIGDCCLQACTLKTLLKYC